MNSGTPNNEVLLLSPHSINYSSRSKQLFEDEVDPPHINNHLIMRSQMKYQTPNKREEGTLIKTEFQDSSMKNGIKEPLSSSKNPYVRFEEQQISPLEKEGQILKRGGEMNVFESPKLSSKNQKAPNSLKKLWETPQKNYRNFSAQQSKIQVDEMPLQQEYKQLLEEVRKNPRAKIVLPFFFDENSQLCAGKLICFELNPKNGRIVRYSPKQRTCLPTFRCFGCGRQFQVASALGGHLSKCREKEQHFEVLQNHIGDCDFDMYLEQKITKNAKKKKQKKQKQNGRGKSKVIKKTCGRKHAMMYKIVGRKNRLVNRGNYPRMAKQRACLRIRQSLGFGFQNNS